MEHKKSKNLSNSSIVVFFGCRFVRPLSNPQSSSRTHSLNIPEDWLVSCIGVMYLTRPCKLLLANFGYILYHPISVDSHT